MKHINYYLREVVAAAILFVVVGCMVHSCIECEKKIDAFFKQRENETVITVED